MLLAMVVVAGMWPAGALGQAKIGMMFWNWRGEDRAFYEGMIQKFEAQNPGISIEFQTYKPTEYNTVLSAAMQAGKGPDIVHLRAYGALQPFARPEFLMPLDDTVPELRTFPRQWIDGARSRADGKIYGVPFVVQALVIFYNKKLLTRAGAAAPTRAWTWDQFLGALRALADHGITPLANGGKEGWTLEVAMGVLAPNFYGGSSFFEAQVRPARTRQTAMLTAFWHNVWTFALTMVVHSPGYRQDAPARPHRVLRGVSDQLGSPLRRPYAPRPPRCSCST